MPAGADPIEWLDTRAGERLRWSGRPSVYPVVPFLVIGLGIGVLGAFIAALLTASSSPLRYVLIGLFIGFGLFVAGWQSAERRSVVYAITTDAVYEKRGMAATPDVATISLDAIESTSEERSALARLTGRGTVRIYAPTATPAALTLDGIGSPNEVRDLLTGHLGETDAGPRSDADPSSARPERSSSSPASDVERPAGGATDGGAGSTNGKPVDGGTTDRDLADDSESEGEGENEFVWHDSASADDNRS